MKVMSIWQPWASLIVYRHKLIETRGWPAPKSLIGQRIAIASTKVVKPEQRVLFLDPDFQRYYRDTGLATLDELPHGCVLGTVLLHSCEPITQELVDDITEEEEMFGWYLPNRFAWRLRDPEVFVTPRPARGQQGIWDWDPDGAKVLNFPGRTDQAGPASLRSHSRAS